MSEGQVTNHSIIVVNIEATILGTRHHSYQIGVAKFCSLGVTRRSGGIAKECCGFRRRLHIAHVLPVLATSLDDITDVVQIEASGLRISQLIHLNLVKRDQVLDGVSASL